MRVGFAVGLTGLALASATAPAPVISLDLDDYTDLKEYTGANAGVPCSGLKNNVKDDTSPPPQFCRARTGINSKGNRFVEQYSRTCAAGTATSTNCALPNAHAYDHHDGALTVVEVIKHVNDDSRPVAEANQIVNGTGSFGAANGIDYSKRGEYTIEYDAVDGSGNRAEQLVFSLVLDGTPCLAAY